MGYTLIDREEFDNVATSYVDFTLNSDYDEILFVLSGFYPSANSRHLGFQFITSGASGYDRPIQATCSGHWLYAFDYSHGDMRYEHSYDSDISHASSVSTKWAMFGVSAHNSYKQHSNASGALTLYKPHDTSFYKYFVTDSQGFEAHISSFQQYLVPKHLAGYVKTTAALTGIRFVSSDYNGNQDGTINYVSLSMYGLE
jgi:hypothetical protein